MAHRQPLRNEKKIEPDMDRAFNKIAAGLNDAIGYAEREKRKGRVFARDGSKGDHSTTRHSLREISRTSQ
ncbi:MAG: hypothetical protein R3E09_12760 [Novosphingobium sp.]